MNRKNTKNNAIFNSKTGCLVVEFCNYHVTCVIIMNCTKYYDAVIKKMCPTSNY